MTPTIIRFEPEVLARLQRFAEAKDVPVAALVRAIVDQFFQRKDEERKP